jgi:hypothetical protein
VIATADTPRRTRGISPVKGTHVYWPHGVEQRYGITAVTRWRWERDKRLPPRDVDVGGKTGWKPETLDAWDRGQPQAA